MRRHLLLQRIAIVAILLVLLAPVAWLIATAWKPRRDIFAIPPSLFGGVSLENFATVARLFDLPRLVWSSLVISLGSTALALALGVPAGYALARLESAWSDRVAVMFLAVRMVPPVATLIPYYLLMRDLHLLGTYWAVVLIDAMQSAAFVVWMMAGYFRAIPRSVEEAALIDGASLRTTFARIALPMALPGLVASVLFCVLFSWNDFLYPAFLTSFATEPLSVALLSAYGTQDITWGTMGALAHFATLPVVAMALLLNRYFVQGLTRGIH